MTNPDDPSGTTTDGEPGLTKREWIASQVFVGIAQREPYLAQNYAALKACLMADQLIAALNLPPAELQKPGL